MSRHRTPRSRRFVFQPQSAERLESRTLLSTGPASMVKDVNVPPLLTDPQHLIRFGNVMMFRATDAVYGNEWYRTNGLPDGTTLLRDINPGPASSHPRQGGGLPATPEAAIAGVVGNTMVFSAHVTGSVGAELWKTDGTTPGTVLLKEIRPGFMGSNPQHFTAVGNTLYFSAHDGTNGFQLWKTDGTEAGTVRLSNIAGTENPTSVVPIGALGSRLIFAAVTPDAGGATPGRELWVSDGSPGGTMLLKNINPAGASNPAGAGPGAAEFAVANGEMYFAATTAEHGRELWKTNGTAAGTVLVADMMPGDAWTAPANMVNVNGTIYFTGRSAGFLGSGVYRTNGVAPGATRIQEMFLPPTVSTGSVRNTFYMVGLSNNATALFKHDPTSPVGTPLTLVKEFDQTSGLESDAGPIVETAGAVLFLMQGIRGETIELWRSTGTAAGTTKVATFLDQPIPDYNEWARWHLTPGIGNEYYFAAKAPGSTVTGLFRTGGTAQSTSRLLDPAATNGASGGVTFVQTPLGPRGLFAGQDREHGRELWITDGTEAGTRLLKDINPGAAASLRISTAVRDGQLVTFTPDINGRVYFLAETAAAGLKLWSTDGTEAGTQPVGNFAPGFPAPASVFAFRGAAHFVQDNQLWRTDGTQAGTTPVASLDPLLLHRAYFVAGDTLYILGVRQEGGSELWKSDGTDAGTSLLAVVSTEDVLATDEFGNGPPMAQLDGRFFFLERPRHRFAVLWSSDGTAGGTTVVKRLPEGHAAHLRVANRRLFFQAGTDALFDTSGTTIWTSNGTSTVSLATIAPEAAGLKLISGLMSTGDVAFFFARDAVGSTHRLWRTDGTAAGTRALRVVPEGTRSLNTADGMFYFATLNAPELWRSDGTEAGTVRVADFRPGPTGANPANLTAGAGRVYFTANDGARGMELWSMPLRPGSLATSSVFYNNSAYDGRDPIPTAADLAAIAPDKAGLLPGQAASFANVTSYDKGINGVLVGVAGALPAGLSADDFVFEVSPDAATWTPAPAPASVALLPGPAGAAVQQYALTWPDRAIRNTWLRVTVLANGQTGLAAPAVFSIGNLVGETVDPDPAGGWAVNAADLAAVHRARGTTASLASTTDINRDGRTNAVDMSLAWQNLNRRLARPADGPVTTSVAGDFNARRQPSRIAAEIGIAT